MKGERVLGNKSTNKDKIFKTAISLFSARGFRGTSIRDIANEMNISISTIYHYFGNKEGLLIAILEHSSKPLVNELKEVVALDLPPKEKLKKLLHTHLRIAGAYTEESKIFFLDEEHLSPEGDRINRDIQREIYRMYRGVLKELDDAGLIKQRNTAILAFNIFGIINWQLRWYRPDGPLSRDEVLDEIVVFIMNGIFGTDES